MSDTCPYDGEYCVFIKRARQNLIQRANVAVANGQCTFVYAPETMFFDKCPARPELCERYRIARHGVKFGQVCPIDGKYCNQVSATFTNEQIARLDKLACLVCRRGNKTY